MGLILIVVPELNSGVDDLGGNAPLSLLRLMKTSKGTFLPGAGVAFSSSIPSPLPSLLLLWRLRKTLKDTFLPEDFACLSPSVPTLRELESGVQLVGRSLTVSEGSGVGFWPESRPSAFPTSSVADFDLFDCGRKAADGTGALGVLNMSGDDAMVLVVKSIAEKDREAGSG